MEPGRRPPNRRDADGRREVAPTWESLVDRQIREAMEQGAFDDLPFQGERLPLEDETFAGDRAMAFHVLRNAGVAPPWIETDKEVRALLDRCEAIFARAGSAPGSAAHASSVPPSPLALRRDRAALEQLVAAVNAAVARLNAEAPTDRQHRRPLVLADEIARFDALVR